MRAMPSRICASVLPDSPGWSAAGRSCGGDLQVVHDVMPSSVWSWRTVFGPTPGDPQERRRGRAGSRREPVVEGEVAGPRQLVDLVADGRPDAGEARRLAVAIGGDEVDRAALDDVGGAVVGDGLEDQLALDLEHVADLVEDPAEIGVGQVGASAVRSVVWTWAPGDGSRSAAVSGRGTPARQAATTRSRPARLAR